MLVKQPEIRRNKRKNRGFTLLEMIIVCVIVIIVATGVTASMGGFLSRSTLRSTAAQVAALGVEARMLALTSGHEVVLRIDASNREAYLLEAIPSEGTSSASQEPQLTQMGNRHHMQLPESIEIMSMKIDGDTVTDGDIPFYSTGGAKPAEIELALTDGGSEVKRITVNKVTGRTKVE
jgi:prepilin-type N-terminal cleavage/methylation domain-containing protein